VHKWLRVQANTSYYDGIKKLLGRWEKKCVENQGDYIEKIMYIIFVIIYKIEL
jgi:hypothetical protein